MPITQTLASAPYLTRDVATLRDTATLPKSSLLRRRRGSNPCHDDDTNQESNLNQSL
jgi:hypothetical protein